MSSVATSAADSLMQLREPEIILESRRRALDTCCAALNSGVVLVTGEAGIGKTWLARQLPGRVAAMSDWVAVEIGTRFRPLDLQRAIAHGLGIEPVGDPRWSLRDRLAESSADGRQLALVIDEVHLAPSDVLEEIRLLSNRLGRVDGFWALVLIGQTVLARRIAARSLTALEARLSARVHLHPLDADEAIALLARAHASRAFSIEEAEALHRDAAGNPRRLLRAAARLGIIPATTSPARPTRTAAAPSDPRAADAPPPPESLLPAKPPIRVEEEMIEVGWDADFDHDELAEDTAQREPAPLSSAPSAEEAVEDHYAALQAWNEWARNHGQNPADMPAGIGAEDLAVDEAEEATLNAERRSTTQREERRQVRAEAQQSFAPYSQLFARVREAKDTER
jgi:general secretion pathway protein A